MGRLGMWLAEKLPAKLVKNSSIVLTIMSIGGICLTCYTAYKAGKQIDDKLEDLYENSKVVDPDTGEEVYEEPETMEIVKTVAPLFIPVIFAALGTGSCVIANYFIESNRLAVSTAACALYKDSYDRYHRYAVEALGEEKDHEIREKIAVERAEDSMKTHVFKESEVSPEDLSNGELFYEPLSSRYFISTKQKILDSVNRMNADMYGSMEIYKDLNEWFTYLGLRCTDMGHLLGWNVNKGMLEVTFNDQYMDSGTKVTIVSYLTPPEYDYR